MAIGDTIVTAANQQRRLTLPDGSVLYVDEATEAKVVGDRRLEVTQGEVFIEVAPKMDEGDSPVTFLVSTPERTVTALGTKFGVRTGAPTRVLVTQGKVKVSDTDEPVTAGQQLLVVDDKQQVEPAPRADVALDWMRPLVIAAEGALIPANEKAGGDLIAVDPDGQDVKLSLRKYHVDIHIEDGFARTTIDQTYFNHMWSRLEGTFYFPLPPDASLSRLAMYVGPNLMEGGMAERDYARQVFETIKTRRLDPALLEWVDGSTFKMRVFPLEGRQEKRIILSYTQKLDISYGRTRYRFSAGHNMKVVGEWSTKLRVKNGARLHWESPSHTLQAKKDGGDLVLRTEEQHSRLDRDVVLFLNDDSIARSRSAVPDDQRLATRQPSHTSLSHTSLSHTKHEDSHYLMLRWRPELPREKVRQRRDWVFLFESSADRNPLLARTQIEIVRTMLSHAEHDDTFAIVTAGAYASAFDKQARPVSQENIAAAIQYLDQTHLVGALDLEQAFRSLQSFVDAADNPTLVHVGSGIPILGERKQNELAQAIPEGAKYVGVGVGVGKRFNRSLMKQAAARTGGYFTQISPDESVNWRGFELVNALNTPRLLDVKIETDSGACKMLSLADSLAHGEELCAIGRYGDAADAPSAMTITGQLDGQPFVQSVPIEKVTKSTGPLPRMWAKQQIELLTSLGAEQHKERIIKLSKAMYVMSPFTSLLVLENEAMYEQYNIDRGRKDHWAIYPAPAKTEVVEEGKRQEARDESKEKEPIERSTDDGASPLLSSPKPPVDEILDTILVHRPAPILRWPSHGYNAARTTTAIHALEVGYELPIRLKSLKFQSLTSGVNVPDTVGPPLLTKIPYVNRLFGNYVSGNQQGSLMMMPNPSVVIQEEEEKRLGISGYYDMPAALDQWQILANSRLLETYGPTNEFRSGRADFESLIDLVTATVQPTTWDEVGGAGTIAPFPGNLSLVVSQTQAEMPAMRNGTEINLPTFPPDLVGGTRLVYLIDDSGSMPIRGKWGEQSTELFKLRRALRTERAKRDQFRAEQRAVAQDEADVAKPSRGSVDVGARRLIDRARALGWQTITWKDEDGKPTFHLTANGENQYQYTRRTRHGLQETVLCNGETLRHHYEEIGLGTNRKLSRFHRQTLPALVPWAVLSADDLALATDVRLLNENTIALVPLYGEQFPHLETHMIFAGNGRLAERRIVSRPGDEVLLRVTHSPQGVVRWLDGEGKEIGKLELSVAPAKRPDLAADESHLVMLPMPARTRDHVYADVQNGKEDFLSDLSEEDAMRLLASDLHTHSDEVQQASGQPRRSLAMLEPLLSDENNAEVSALWRLGSTLANKQGMTARSAKMLEQAFALKYGALEGNDVVDLAQLRRDYGELLSRYEQLATALVSLEEKPSVAKAPTHRFCGTMPKC